MDDRLVIVDVAGNESEVSDVAAVEHIDDVANEERYRTEQCILQHITDHGERQRNRPHLHQSKVDKRQGKGTGEYVAHTTGNQSEEWVEEILVHIFCGRVHHTV